MPTPPSASREYSRKFGGPNFARETFLINERIEQPEAGDPP